MSTKEEIETWLKEPRPEDLDSSLTTACSYIKALLKQLEASENVISTAKDVVLLKDEGLLHLNSVILALDAEIKKYEAGK